MAEPADPVVLRWETLSKAKVDRLERSECVVLVTCSPLEVHGPHLPLVAVTLVRCQRRYPVLRYQGAAKRLGLPPEVARDIA